ncbi:MAG: hypothetical protein ACJAVO_003001 [Parvibaculaceae bacterium]|jgi:hypothetical protein|nr:outer membrane beta-barrel protein [Parvibaculaceae bacterium]
MSQNKLKISVAVAALLSSMTGYAAAEDVRGQGVADRARPDYDAIGVRTGSFLFYPSVTVGESYDDNIYAAETNTESDFVTDLSTQLSLVSTWSRHELILNATADAAFYAENDDENTVDWGVGATGRIDIVRDSSIDLAASYDHLTEDRGSANAIGVQTEPTEYDLLYGLVAINHKFNRVSLRVEGTYSDYDYDNGSLIGGGVSFQDDRDRAEMVGTVQVGYDVSPDTNVFLRGSINERDYDLDVPAATVDRDSDGYEVVAGVEFGISSLASGEIYAGYQEQDYTAAALDNISGLAFGVDVEWYLTPLTTVRATASSSVEETINATASGYLSNSYGLGLDHELMRNVIVSADVGYTTDEYEGITRTEDTLTLDLGVDYLINRNFRAEFGYTYTNRDSDTAGRGYDNNVVGFSLKAQL